MTHFSWPKLGEKIKHKTIEGTVVSLSQRIALSASTTDQAGRPHS